MSSDKYYVRRYSPGWAIFSRSTPAFPVRIYALADRMEVMRICDEMNTREHRVVPDLQPSGSYSTLPVH
jgi:hypothetical protein